MSERMKKHPWLECFCPTREHCKFYDGCGLCQYVEEEQEYHKDG